LTKQSGIYRQAHRGGGASHTPEIYDSRVYRLNAPGLIEEVVIQREVPEGHVVVEPSVASICHADLRYYTGNRRKEVLAKKLPMALIHEGIGRIVKDSGSLGAGQRVAIVPNMPGHLRRRIAAEQCCPVCKNDPGGNYCHNGEFLGSGVDGIAQSRLVIPEECAIPVPQDVPDEIAVLTELCSVSYQALRQVEPRLHQAQIAVFGDGPVGYLTAAVLHRMFHVEKERLLVFGAIPEKLRQFEFATQSLVQEYDFAKKGRVCDMAIECTGGMFSESAINQAIDLLRPRGCLVLMGVSEQRVPINTRDVLEKGITVIGSSRSCYKDYPPVLAAMKDPSFRAMLRKLIPADRRIIRSAEQFSQAMAEAAAHREWTKMLLEFQWH